MIKNVFYDLDGTLLPMDMDVFVSSYFKLLVKKAISYGLDGDKIVPSVWGGIKAIVANDGAKTNNEVFWDYFLDAMNISKDMMAVFDDFYANEFEQVRHDCGYNDKAPELIKTVKEMGLNQVLATNPIFPEIATGARIRWAGLDINDFECVTTFENCHYCKPSPNYYKELLDKVGMKPEETLMIGNDAEEDMVAETLGMKVFLLTDCLVNSKNRDISGYPQGNFDDALKYIKTLI